MTHSLVKEYKEIFRLITKNKEKLQATMTDVQKELFSQYTDAVRECQTLSECLLFRKRQTFPPQENSKPGFHLA